MSGRASTMQLCVCCRNPIAPGVVSADLNITFSIRHGTKTAVAAPVCPMCTDRAKASMTESIEIMRAGAAHLLGKQESQ